MNLYKVIEFISKLFNVDSIKLEFDSDAQMIIMVINDIRLPMTEPYLAMQPNTETFIVELLRSYIKQLKLK